MRTFWKSYVFLIFDNIPKVCYHVYTYHWYVKKLLYLYIEVLFPMIWIISFVLWKILIRKIFIVEALKDGAAVTAIMYLILNLLLYINYEKIFLNDK